MKKAIITMILIFNVVVLFSQLKTAKLISTFDDKDKHYIDTVYCREKYETTFILSPQADDATFDRQIQSVSDLISKYGGNVLLENRMGVRRLAYQIKKFTQGFYTYIVF